MRNIISGIMTVLTLSFFTVTAAAQGTSEWPGYHGTDRTNKSTETGLQKTWPEKGPKLLWTASGLGEGYSTVSIAGGYVYSAGKIGKQTYVIAYDMDGKQVWKTPNGEAWETTMSYAKGFTGSRCTPTYNDGVVYHFGETGRLAAFDHATGKEKWALDLRERFDAPVPKYGFSESVLIDGDRLYCSPAGKKGFMVCLGKKDGKLIWSCTDIPGTAGYASPILVEFGGIRQVMNMSSGYAYGVDSQTGKFLWSTKFENFRSINATDPVFLNSHVFVTTGYGKGSGLIKLVATNDGIKAEIIWEKLIMDNH
ncbi:PQQ-binding-like beta-propeller repeat protein, partial [Candidatus Latescibacterota bacterium]